MLPYFKLNDYKAVKDLMQLTGDEPLTAHDALSALINLSSDLEIIGVMCDDVFLTSLVVLTVLPKNVNADLCCMLLNNLSKFEIVAEKLLPAPSADPGVQKTHRIDNLLEIFARGETSKYNPAASFHFLAGVFANLTTSPQGCEFFLSRSTVDNSPRLSKLVVFTEHSDTMRRGGVVSAIKNCCYGASVAKHGEDVLFSEELNLLVYLLLPLAGPEDYTDEEMDGMPDELQFLEPTKIREPDARIRHTLVETLLLLTTTRYGRDFMRACKVYPIIRQLHLVEKSEAVQEAIEEVVNMLMRDESQETADGTSSAAHPSKMIKLDGEAPAQAEAPVEQDEADAQIEALI
ncbi:Protein hgh1 [Polyrhizophydium stewartii]|uniref:Protein hgh1 n=1 Tax=Polyrhizophydium stewartii TaxID=2732419 RepID=A0ABR4N7L7_9FUNG|nr:hypothetical protein HK105_004376 [Polyrhizophydium stewartii]